MFIVPGYKKIPTFGLFEIAKPFVVVCDILTFLIEQH